MIKYVLLFLVAVFISAVSQILLKESADKKHDSFIQEFLNPKVIIAYSIFFSATLITMFSYKVLPFSLGTILETTGYIWVALLSRIVLKEEIKKRKMVGLIIIILGILIYSL